jgi:2-methylisocitrate lyase-like PEP mutase family enzyme
VVFIAGGLNYPKLEKLARQTFKDVAVMDEPHQSSTKRYKDMGIKIISYPDLFTHGLYQGVSDKVRGFCTKGGIASMKTVRHPDDAENMGGIRDLLASEECPADSKKR